MPVRPISTSSSTVTLSKRPPRRTMTLSDVDQSSMVGGDGGGGGGGGTVSMISSSISSISTGSSTTELQHKPSFRHVSTGALFKSVQGGDAIREKNWSMIREEISVGSDSTANSQGEQKRQDTSLNGTRSITRHRSYSTNNLKGMSYGYGKNAVAPRGRSKLAEEVATTGEQDRSSTVSSHGESDMSSNHIINSLDSNNANHRDNSTHQHSRTVSHESNDADHFDRQRSHGPTSRASETIVTATETAALAALALAPAPVPVPVPAPAPAPALAPTVAKEAPLPEIHPGEQVFTPIVSCRYPEKDWEDSDPFPPHLEMFCFPGNITFKLQQERPATTYHSFVTTHEAGNRSYATCVTFYERLPDSMREQYEERCLRWTRSQMSEGEIEFIRALKVKISRERSLLRGLRRQWKEEKSGSGGGNLGQRRAHLLELKGEIVAAEENLIILEEQMKPFKRKFVEADDVWVPRCVGLVSALPYHYLMRDWLLAVVVACSGGVEHPNMSLTSFRLESYVKNIIHDVGVPPFGRHEIAITVNNRTLFADRPALNKVPLVKNFSIFPLFRCLSDEDIVTILEGIYIPVLPAALMTILQAPVPYIIGVERSCCDPEFPPENSCIVDLDKGCIDVQLPPIPIPSRPRRKLLQLLEQYAPTSLIRRPSSSGRNGAPGPPEFIKEAYSFSRMSLLCVYSRAPRGSSSNRRPESMRPPVASTITTASTRNPTFSTITSSSDYISPTISRKSSSNTLGQQQYQSHSHQQQQNHGYNPNSAAAQSQPSVGLNSLPKLPRMDFEREALMEGCLIGADDASSVAGSYRDKRSSESIIYPSDSASLRTVVLDDVASTLESGPLTSDELSIDTVSTATRKILSPARSRANMYEMPRKQDSSASLPSLSLLPTNGGHGNSAGSAASGSAMPQGIHHQHHAITRSASSQNLHQGSTVGFDPQNKHHNMTMGTKNGNANMSAARELTHRASLTSIESSNSSMFPRSIMQGPRAGSQVSTMTSNTMASINGPSTTTLPTYLAAAPMIPSLSEQAIIGGVVDDEDDIRSIGSGGTGNGSMLGGASVSSGNVLGGGMAMGVGVGAVGSNAHGHAGPGTGRTETITKDGHVFSSVSVPVPLAFLNNGGSRCWICVRAIEGHQYVYRCEGCAHLIHAGFDLSLCAWGFDESAICWSVLQMWAGLLKGYRSGILAGAAAYQQQQQQQQYQHPYQFQQQPAQYQNHNQNNSPRGLGHAKQLSSSGSEGGDREGRERSPWATFSRWTTRVAGSTAAMASASSGNVHGHGQHQHPHHSNGSTQSVPYTRTGGLSGPGGFSPQQQSSGQRGGRASSSWDQSQQPPTTRARSGTMESMHSDTVRFHRDVFMKSVDKEARPFMSVLADSQAFVQFVQDRVDRSPGDPEVMFFDEVIKAKINRYLFKIGKEETKFLNDPSYGVQTTIRAVPPSGDIQVFEDESRRFPTTLDPAYL
ncbi:hypothetical protein BGW38_001446 [Lunasporangiospora selenospora]|uniref:UDENN domain-containing protein n=1 Tax=Lunasporangiospora selenospora TaxID=979761 RepID=A0A9P6FUB1_9FUNG|nr:hypothetical protein BGW38_001446 [Lunasporangiospora selenospora]